ncbi:hypothetical protein IPH67_05315 [bacterium]|nr:MAG: hypothetical protein IPH67_05315 [bacterium]
MGTEALQAGIWVTNQNKKFGNLRFDPFLKLNVRHDTNSSNSDENYLGSFKTENQKGFVIGSNGILRIDDNSYLINVGLEKIYFQALITYLDGKNAVRAANGLIQNIL